MVRWIAFVSLTVGCVEGDFNQLSPDGAGFLHTDVDQTYAERMLAPTWATARLVNDGAELVGSHAPREPITLVVVDPEDGQIRGSYEDRYNQILLWFDRHDLVDVVYEQSRAFGSPSGGLGSIEFRGGAVVEVVESDDDSIRVTHEGEYGWVTGWLSDTEVDQYWLQEPVLPSIDWDTTIPGDVEIFDEPDGALIAITAPLSSDSRRVGWIPAQYHGEPVDGWQELTVTISDHAVVTGYADAREIRTNSMGGKGGSGGFSSMCGMHWGAQYRLPSGTVLSAWPDGPAVARTKRPRALHTLQHDGNWVDVIVSTPWGTADLSVGEWDVLGPE